MASTELPMQDRRHDDTTTTHPIPQKHVCVSLLNKKIEGKMMMITLPHRSTKATTQRHRKMQAI
jgi:hypothetical protein